MLEKVESLKTKAKALEKMHQNGKHTRDDESSTLRNECMTENKKLGDVMNERGGLARVCKDTVEI